MLFDAAARAHPDRIALVEHRDSAPDRQWTFGELHAGLRWVGGALLAAGLAPGDRVAIMGSSSACFLIADCGIAAAGLVRVPLDPSLSFEEHAAQLADAGARVMVYEPSFRERAQALADNLSLIAVFATEGDGAIELTGIHSLRCPPAESIDPGSLASLNYTGGSTGSPKAVMLTHHAFATIVANIISGHPIRRDDVFLNVRPLWPIAAVMVTAHLAGGARVVLGGRFDTGSFLELCQRYAVTVTSLVPTTLVRLVDTVDPGAYRLDALRAINIGGSATPPDVFERAIAAFGPKIGVIYGLTEASYTCYLKPESLSMENGRSADQVATRMRSVGQSLGDNEVVIRGPDGRSLPSGEIGEVTISGEHLMLGYWNRPALTQQALRNGYLHTGDLGKLDAQGWLTVTGRLKEVIRSGTKTVLPGEVEDALRAHPDVEDCKVVGLPDREWGEIVAAAVVRRAGSTVDAEVLLEHCRKYLSSFKKPRVIEFFDELPKSHYGKVMRGKILAALTERLLTASKTVRVQD